MNPTSSTFRCFPGLVPRLVPRLVARPVVLLALFCCLPLIPKGANACLTANIDKRAVQWSTMIVQAKLSGIGDKIELPGADPTAKRPSGRPTATAYRQISFEVTDTIDGAAQPGDIIKAVVLVGGQAGDGICPPMRADSVGKKFILLLRPFDQTSLDVPDNTSLDVGHGAMVIVSQLGESDMNSETLNDLKAFVAKTRATSATANDQLAAQVDTVATAHDDTEAEAAEKAITEIGADSLPALQARLATANDAGKTRLKQLIDDLSPPALSAEPE
jgi:hypothetical protein